jgi:hypothetical protein
MLIIPNFSMKNRFICVCERESLQNIMIRIYNNYGVLRLDICTPTKYNSQTGSR